MIIVSAGPSLISQHAAHALAIGIPVAMLAIGLSWDAWRKRRRAPRRAHPTPRLGPLRVAAAASVVAAAVHVNVMPEHVRESLLYGGFFAAAAACQLGGAVLLLRRRTWQLTWLVALGNAAIVALWLVTRLIAIPLGPDAGATESFGVLDVLASIAEAVVVAGCAASLRAPRRTALMPVGVS